MIDCNTGHPKPLGRAEISFTPHKKIVDFFSTLTCIYDPYLNLHHGLLGKLGEERKIQLIKFLQDLLSDIEIEYTPRAGEPKALGMTQIEAAVTISYYMHMVAIETFKMRNQDTKNSITFFETHQPFDISTDYFKPSKSGTFATERHTVKLAHRIVKKWMRDLALKVNLTQVEASKELKKLIKENANRTITKTHQLPNFQLKTLTAQSFNCFNYAFHKLNLPEMKCLSDNRHTTTQSFQLSLDPVEKIISDLKFSLTSHPECGDLIVYLDDEKFACHYGVFIDSEWVESKWSDLPVYKHRPSESPYGNSYVVLRPPLKK